MKRLDMVSNGVAGPDEIVEYKSYWKSNHDFR